jgi:HK97 family phage major capsid protein
MPPGVTITPEQIEQLTEGITSAKAAMVKGQEEMAESNKQVGALLTQQEELKKSRDKHGQELEKVQKSLNDFALKMEGISHQYTDTIDTLRAQTKQMVAGGVNSDGAVYQVRIGNGRDNHGGSIFSCRQEALELGMFLMATMKSETDAKRYSRQWLADHRQHLRYLPNIPKSFIESIANPIVKKEDVDRIVSGFGNWGAVQAMSGLAAPGAALVHPEFANTLIRNVEMHGAFRANALVWPMGGDVVYIPRRKTGAAVVWETEAGAGEGTDPTFDMLGLTAKKMMALNSYSSELGEDAALSLADIFMFDFALAIAEKEDDAGFNGDGTSPYALFTGVLGASANATESTADSTFVPILVTGAAGANLTTEITAAKLREMTGHVHSWARPGCKWYMSRSVLSDVTGIETTGGGPVVRIDEGNLARIMGYPVVEVEKMPASPSAASTKVLACGDLRKSWILGDRRKLELQTSEHYLFNTDSIAVRVTSRVGVLMQCGNGMVVYCTGTA